ncbi:hypothetical protein ES708_31157 [subsurface metagenome]
MTVQIIKACSIPLAMVIVGGLAWFAISNGIDGAVFMSAVLTIGGMKNYFLIYSYPPAGVEIARPEDVLTYELWRGWILQLVNYEPTYHLDTATYREGYSAFKARKTELGY